MKLNFWQIVGIVLIILAAIAIYLREHPTDQPYSSPPAATPATAPSGM